MRPLVRATATAAATVDTPIWTITKEGRAVSAVVRISPGGPELRFLVDSELLWSMVLREPGAVGRMAAEKRAEFEAMGWASAPLIPATLGPKAWR